MAALTLEVQLPSLTVLLLPSLSAESDVSLILTSVPWINHCQQISMKSVRCSCNENNTHHTCSNVLALRSIANNATLLLTLHHHTLINISIIDWLVSHIILCYDDVSHHHDDSHDHHIFPTHTTYSKHKHQNMHLIRSCCTVTQPPNSQWSHLLLHSSQLRITVCITKALTHTLNTLT